MTNEERAREIATNEWAVGYSMALTRLVDDESTYTVTIKSDPPVVREFSGTDECYAFIAQWNEDARAAAILAALDAAERRGMERAARLWALLDDIDTVSDMAKSDDAGYRATVERIQRKRFDIMTGEEYDAAIRAAAKEPGE